MDTKRIKSGTSQENRFLKALDFDYVKIDERSFKDLLVFSYGFSKLINYYNLEDQIDGDWSEFLNDETLILATIIDSNPTEIEIRFKENLHKANLFLDKKTKVKYLKKCYHEIYNLALRFESWLVKLKAVEKFTSTEVSVRKEVVNAVTLKLSAALQRLKSYDIASAEKNGLNEPMGLNYSVFSNIWKLEDSVEEAVDIQGRSNLDKIQKITTGLEQVFQEFYETLLYLKIKAPEYLSQSLKNDKHYPEVALFLTFLKLFEHSQRDINNLSQRHLEFYYAEVLKQQPKPANYDQAYLKFKLYDTAFSAEVPIGTRFLAGMDEQGNDVVYKADDHLIVNKAKIEKLHTIFVSNDPLNIKGVKKDLYSNILASSIPVQKELQENDGSATITTYATFGEGQGNKGESEKTMSSAKIGFAIASPNLQLSEGDREIDLTFNFVKEEFKVLQQYLSDITELSQKEKNQNENAEKKDEIIKQVNQEEVDSSETFVKIFMEAFHISITVETGWHKVKNYIVTQNRKEETLKVHFELKSAEPVVVSFDSRLHEDKFEGNAPVIKFELNSEGYVYPYSLLKKMHLDRITIDTHVYGAKKLLLQNNLGELNAANPFLPFGPTPKVGSYLMIGSNEIFQKSLNKLNVNIEWFDLPKTTTGFKEHYQEYELDIDNSSFELNVSALDNGIWHPQESSMHQKFKLFRTSDNKVEIEPKPEGLLYDKTCLQNIDTEIIGKSPDYSKMNEPSKYDNMVQRGFLKLELTGPLFAFAHSVYPTVLSKVALNNSRISFLKKKPKDKEPPKPAYTPQMKSISLDYSSSSVISFDRSKKKEESQVLDRLFHILPFGENMVFPDDSKQHTKLLADYDFEGALIIGFTNLNPPQTVTMLFEMIDEFTVSSEDDPPTIEWQYLVKNEWNELHASRIIEDETQGFLKTGIISIKIPPNITDGNSLLDPDYYWIRAVVIKNIDVASKIVGVDTQVLTATFDDVNKTALKGNHLKEPLPKGSIKRSIDNIVGVESVKQPLKSFNGLPKESSTKFYTRTAERLRHKKRAITAWDYERLILQKFHEVFKVTCLPNMTSKNLDSPGSVLIVVTPYNTDMVNPNEPMASSELLYKIKSYVQDYISPFVKLEVRNPNFERLKIVCSVKYKEGYNFGFYTQKLKDEIKKYISRSILAGDRSVDLGGKMNTSDILSFIRTLPYIEFITKFSMIQTARDFGGRHVLLDTAREDDPKSFLKATKPWSVLVSSNDHQLTVLNEKMEEQSLQSGIDSLELGHDFIID